MENKLNNFQKIVLDNKKYFLIPDTPKNQLKFKSLDSSLKIKKKNNKMNLKNFSEKNKNDINLIKNLKKENSDLEKQIKRLRKIESGFFGKDFLREFKELKKENKNLLELNQSFKTQVEELENKNEKNNKNFEMIKFSQNEKIENLLKEIEKIKNKQIYNKNKNIINFVNEKKDSNENLINFVNEKKNSKISKNIFDNNSIKIISEFDQKSFLSDNSTKITVKNKEKEIKKLKKTFSALEKKLIITKYQIKLLQQQKMDHKCNEGYKQLYIDSENILEKYKKKLNEKIKNIKELKKINFDLKKNFFWKKNDFKKNGKNFFVEKSENFLNEDFSISNEFFDKTLSEENLVMKEKLMNLKFSKNEKNSKIWNNSESSILRKKDFINDHEKKNYKYIINNSNSIKFVSTDSKLVKNPISNLNSKKFVTNETKLVNSKLLTNSFNIKKNDIKKNNSGFENDIVDIALKNVVLELELKRVYDYLGDKIVKEKVKNEDGDNSLKRFSFKF